MDLGRRLLMPLVMLVLLSAACSPGGPGPTTQPAKPAEKATSAERSAALQALIEAAGKEGRVNWATTVSPEVVAGMNKRFNERFGTNITVELVPLRNTEVNARIRQEVAAGKITVDVIHPSSQLVFSLLNDKVDAFEKFDWLGTFGDTLPGLKSTVERVPDVLRGLGLEHQHVIRAIIYNKNLLKSDELPKKWEDLLDPKWKGRKIVIDPQASSTYLLVAKWDQAKVLDYSVKIAAQDPLWIGSSDNIALAVARGEALLGITAIQNVKDLQDQKQPVDIAPTEFYPGTQQLSFPVKGSPHINAARLWTAWVVTEGNKVGSELGETRDQGWPESDSWTSRKIAELKGELAMIITQEQLIATDKLRTQIVSEYKRIGVQSQ